MRTLSPGPKSVKQVLKSDCFDPLLTIRRSGSTARPPLICDRALAIAWRSSLIPTLGAYRVLPARIAAMPASEAGAGVSKSGSPTPRSRTFSPAALRRFASVLMATVSEDFRCSRFGDRLKVIAGLPVRSEVLTGGERFAAAEAVSTACAAVRCPRHRGRGSFDAKTAPVSTRTIDNRGTGGWDRSR